jgi:Na+-translocating ferredoxin:NAD+ oxidoreductase RnfG subunit
MQWKSTSCISVMCLASISPAGLVCAKQYLSIDEVKQVMFSGEIFKQVELDIPIAIKDLMRKESGVRYAYTQKHVWKSNQGSWLLVDEVVGKHEMITYAVGIHANGQIQGVEILEYNESYGEQIREKKWLQQFKGRDANQTLRFNEDIKNITGATLSSKHVTNGVQRLMVLYREYLSKA